jgi:hypothetical protein
MILNNLTDRQRLVADILWMSESKEDLNLRLRSLPREDQLTAAAITELMIMGGDEVEDTQEAARVLSKYRLTA